VPRHDSRRSLLNRGTLPLLTALCAAVLLLAGCNSVTPTTSERTLTFHMPACLFGSPTAAVYSDQGPGIDTIGVIATLTGGTTAEVSGSFAAASFTGTYSSFTITVDGTLTGITVSGTAAGAEVVSASVTDFPEAEMARYGGYTLFGNVTHFKLDWTGGGDPAAGMMRILPCPRSSATLLVDSGAVGAAGLTDRKASLTTLQVAIQPVAAEDVSDESLTYTVYYAVSTDDPSIKYSTATWEGTKLENPWTAQWNYAEVTGGAGKLIGTTTYVLQAAAGGAKIVGKADSYGKFSTMIDLSGSAEANQYLLYSVLLTRAGISVPTDVGCVKIN
jgi:hypothetical protein